MVGSGWAVSSQMMLAVAVVVVGILDGEIWGGEFEVAVSYGGGPARLTLGGI